MLGQKSIEQLSPFLEGDGPLENGEWAMFCPYHDDNRRSASINIDTEYWYCQPCRRGGEARHLLADRENWRDPSSLNGHTHKGGSVSRRAVASEEITEAKVDGWASALMSNKKALSELKEKRGLTTATIKKYQLGWDGKVYTIPVRDFSGQLVNVRRYDMNPGDERRKIWSVAGHGTPVLWPMDQLDAETILICEGEFDALVAIQNGIPAITRTGAADVWKPEWGQLFRGKRVFVCHDMDAKGQEANLKVVAGLRGKTRSTTVVALPYDISEKHGKDITDFFVVDGRSKADFVALTRQGKKYEALSETAEPDSPTLVPVSVMDSFDGKLVDKPLAMQVTVTGKRIPSYLVPKVVEFSCDKGAGPKCKNCSIDSTDGLVRQEIGPDSPLILAMVNTTDASLGKVIKTHFEVNTSCPRVTMNPLSHRTVEEIYVRPSIEVQAGGPTQDFTHRKVISAASHDLSGNQTVDLFGTIRPDPNKQTNEFQAWKVEKPKNTLESFKMTPEIREQLEVFQCDDDPLGKLHEIADELAGHITKIYHRPEMHIFMDLVIHSGLYFELGERGMKKGWLDAIIVGDTRTGKSEAAAKLISEYGMGEMISCESVSFAGVMGGLDRIGDGQWIVQWGSVPTNDRRVVVLDEASGLHPEHWAQLSDLRSSGVAKITKIRNEQAMARTRLLWLANPREARMDDFTYGVNALRPLVGNNEDLARFDMAMGVFSSDVDAGLINAFHHDVPTRKHDREALRNLIRWCWTREAQDIVIGKRAMNLILERATALGHRYVDRPPLVLDAAPKLARVAVAVAMRTYSADSRDRCVVRPDHVDAADRFLQTLYDNPSFGYGVISDQRNADRSEAIEGMDGIISYIVERPGLMRFLKHTPVFERRAVETVLNLSPDMANSVINELWIMKAVIFEDNQLKIEPAVLKRIREMQQ